ncbi:MAG: hypothetical protein ABIT83_03950 [Massilia sp.]
MDLLPPFSQYLRHAWNKWSRFWHRKDAYSCVNLDDPVASALADTDLLLAFAAQSSRKIDAKKVEALIHSAEAYRREREGVASPARAAIATAFWSAFDDFAVELAPLSACSIRSSIEINARCFPKSFFTPTAGNACCAVIVFAAGLALQGFWVSGKDLVDMAISQQAKNTELNAAMATRQAEVDSAINRFNAVRHKVGAVDNCTLEVNPAAPAAAALQHTALKGGCDEFMPAVAALEDKKQQFLQAEHEIRVQAERGRPLSNLVMRWYLRATTMCNLYGMSFICPVERRTDQELLDATDRVAQLRAKLAGHDATAAPSLASPTRGDSQTESLSDQLRTAEVDYAKAFDAQSASLLVQSKMIVANVGAYLIPMLMGVLGALTFILRSLSQSLREHTYMPVSVSVYIVRICLGAIAGVFGGLLATAGDPTFKTLNLPPLFVPFVFGYGIEILFALLDRVVRTFTQPESGPARGVGA